MPFKVTRSPSPSLRGVGKYSNNNMKSKEMKRSAKHC